MAEFKNDRKTSVNGETKKELAHDEAGMMIDAKEYAKRDASTLFKVLDKLDFDIEEKEELIIKTLVSVKFEQIDKARNDRPSYMKFLD